MTPTTNDDKVFVDAQELDALRKDADRYIWLLANMGSVERHAVAWNPAVHKPLLVYIQDFIDDALTKESLVWVETKEVGFK